MPKKTQFTFTSPQCDRREDLPTNINPQWNRREDLPTHINPQCDRREELPIHETINLADTGTLADVLTELTQKIGQSLVQRKEPTLYRQVITVPGPAGRVLQAFRRLPEQQPDVLQRIYVVKPERDIIDLLISCPSGQNMQYIEKTIHGRPQKPLIMPRLVQTTTEPTNYSHSYGHDQFRHPCYDYESNNPNRYSC